MFLSSSSFSFPRFFYPLLLENNERDLKLSCPDQKGKNGYSITTASSEGLKKITLSTLNQYKLPQLKSIQEDWIPLASFLNLCEYDEKYDEAVAVVTETGQASISMVQRRLRVGYNRAARMIEMMETLPVPGKI